MKNVFEFIINNNIIYTYTSVGADPARIYAQHIYIYCTSDSPTASMYFISIIIIIIIIVLVSNCLHEGPALRVWATTKVSDRVNGDHVYRGKYL